MGRDNQERRTRDKRTSVAILAAGGFALTLVAGTSCGDSAIKRPAIYEIVDIDGISGHGPATVRLNGCVQEGHNSAIVIRTRDDAYVAEKYYNGHAGEQDSVRKLGQYPT